MAIAAMRVPTIFTAVDRFSDVVTKMTMRTSAFGKTAEAAAMRTSRGFNRVGTNMLTAGVGMAVGIGYAVNEAVKYEAAVASLAAVTGTSVGSMNKQIEGLGLETKRSVIDIAKSFEIVGSKMSQYLDKPEALKGITKASILMADAARMELEPSIESLTGVLNIFGKSAKDANYIVNKLSAGEIVGSISIAETADVLRQFGGTARLASVQVDESIALIQTLTKSLGIDGVGRGIRNLMTDLNMVGAFDKNKTKALAKAGVDMDVLGNKSLDLLTRLRELKKLEGNSAAMGLFFKKTGIQTGATLFQNFDDYVRFLDLIQKTNAAQEQADKNNATMAKKIKDLKAQVSLLAIKIGDALIPRIKSMVDNIMPVVQNIAAWAKENRGFANTLMTVAKWLLILGVVAKVGAFLFYGLSKVLALITFVSETYAAVTSLVAAAQLAQAFSGASLTTVMWGLAASLLAAYWPVLLILGALGLLTYSMASSIDSTETMANRQIAALDKGNSAWRNSTDVMARELEKQRNLKNPPKSPITPEQTKMNTILAAADKRKTFSANRDLSGNKINTPINQSIAKRLFENRQMDATLGKDKASTLRNNGFTFEEFKKIYPNVAGYSERSQTDKKQELTLNLVAPPGYGLETVGAMPSGINVITKRNQGER